MEMSIIAVGNIFIDLESGKKCKVKEICYSPKDNSTTVVFRFEDEREERINGEEVTNTFAKVSGF